MRGGAWNNNRDNARCAYRNRNDPDNRNDNLGFRVVLRAAHVLPPFFWPRRTARRRTRPLGRGRSGNASRSARAGLLAEAKEEEQRQAGLVRAHAERQGDTGASLAPGAYTSRGTARQSDPPCLAPLHDGLVHPPSRSPIDVPAASDERVCLIQPPSSLPMAVTMRLTCSYCPLLSQFH